MSDDPLFTLTDARAKALADYASVLGTIVCPDWIVIYQDNVSHDIHAAGRVQARVIPTKESDVTRICDTHVDPYWDLEIVSDPDNILAGYEPSSTWTWGMSYRIE